MPDFIEQLASRVDDSETLESALTSLYRQGCDLPTLCSLLSTYAAMKNGPVERVERQLIRRRNRLRRLVPILKRAFDEYNRCGDVGCLKIHAESLLAIYLGTSAQLDLFETLVGHRGALKKEAWIAAAVSYVRQVTGKPHYRKIADIVAVLCETVDPPWTPAAGDIRKRSVKYTSNNIRSDFAAELVSGVVQRKSKEKSEVIAKAISVRSANAASKIAKSRFRTLDQRRFSS